ncbi:MAG TPA: amidohydrolase [Candidatus Eisenbacteria bacterium]|nr:amidohydrolase [Candidatus Eisenbacteria bacterium]
MKTLARTLAEDTVKQLVAVRRDLHQHPETAFEEVRTAGVVAERLRKLGLEPRTGVAKTGVIATVRGAKPGKTVLLRADMDALPIQEENDTPYRSEVPGKMHACGHDCHTSILLGVANELVRDASELTGAVRLCFQPAEECGGGAEGMIKEGALDPKPDATFGLHVWQDLDLGQVGVTPGPFMASVDEFTVTVKGKGAHAAMPQLGIDPVVCLAHMISALQTIASRNASPFAEVVVSVTQVKAGTAFNIIPETAWMNGTVRVFDRALWEALPGHFERIVRGVAEAFHCSAEIDFTRFNSPTVNDPAMAALAREAAAEIVGRENVREDIRTMGGEDYSAFLRQVPGCFIAIGSRNTARGLVHGHHHPRFDVDEACLAIGAEVLLRTTRRFLGEGK